MELNKLKSVLEALILVSEEPLTFGSMVLILEPEGVTKDDIETALSELKNKYDSDSSSGIFLLEVAGGYQFRTKAETAAYIQKLNIPKPSKLSQQALETLAIIAYRQPVVRSEIEDIRGVDSGGVLKTLLERNLIRIVGKRDDPGNPLIYGTTNKFLEMFNLNELKELPTLREFEELEKEYYKGGEQKAEALEPILQGVVTEPLSQKWSAEDENLIGDLKNSIKNLRRLEKDIFPKPIETIVAVPTDPNQPKVEGEDDAGTTPEGTGAGD